MIVLQLDEDTIVNNGTNTNIPTDTYFYEDGTEGENIVRYKKINDEYFVCNENGEVLEGTQVTDVTSKTLIEYTAITASTISAGHAGYAEELYLGNGVDNITYVDKNAEILGYNKSISLGTGTTFDVTSYENYESFTSDNFIVELKSVKSANTTSINSESGGNVLDASAIFGGITVKKTYDATTGTLKITPTTARLTVQNSARNAAATAKIEYNVYLKY